MSFNERLVIALQLMDQRGIKRRDYAPPLHRVMWRLGLKVPPPMLAGFSKNVLSFGVYFGVTWGLLFHGLMSFVFDWQLGVSIAVGSSVLAGVLFGLWMGVVLHRTRRKHNLPLWNDISSRSR